MIQREILRNLGAPGSYANKLALSHFLREPLLRRALEKLQIPHNSKGVDAGCGIGLPTLLLAETVGPTGHVTGVDQSAQFLKHARALAEEANLADRISYRQGDVNRLPFDGGSFDWACSIDCAGYYRGGNPVGSIKELARVVKPGGLVAIMAWSSQQLLPGYPFLEARLNATSAGVAPFAKDDNPHQHFSRALGWFREAGLQSPMALTFVGEVQAPLTEDVKEALLSLFDMRWGEAQSEVPQEDWDQYQNLIAPKSQQFILALPDYYAFFTYTLFHGFVP